MVMASFGDVVLPYVLFLRFALKSSKSVHSLATGKRASVGSTEAAKDVVARFGVVGRMLQA
jgi:hypothetical protein